MKTFAFSENLFIPVYFPYYKDTNRYLILFGGAGSGKSTFAAQKILLRLMSEKEHRFLLIRKYQVTVKKSQFQLLQDLIIQWNLKKYFEIKKTDLEIIYKPNGNKIITSGMDNSEKLKSIQGITGIWIEEATELSYKDFLQIDLRLRGKTLFYKQIIMTFNPVDYTHWIYDKYFSNKVENAVTLKTTYLDNPFLDNDYIKLLDELNSQDLEFANIYAKGEWGRLQNLIYGEIKIVAEIPKNINSVFYALDFGFNNPTALLKFYEKDSNYYLKEEIYERKLTIQDLSEKLEKIISNRNDVIYADPEEAAGIELLLQNGFNVKKAKKEVKAGIDLVKTLIKQEKIFSLQSNQNFQKELLSYKYKTNSNGEFSDEPIKFNDHLMDCLRYGIYSVKSEFQEPLDILIFNKRRRKK